MQGFSITHEIKKCLAYCQPSRRIIIINIIMHVRTLLLHQCIYSHQTHLCMQNCVSVHDFTFHEEILLPWKSITSFNGIRFVCLKVSSSYTHRQTVVVAGKYFVCIKKINMYKEQIYHVHFFNDSAICSFTVTHAKLYKIIVLLQCSVSVAVVLLADVHKKLFPKMMLTMKIEMIRNKTISQRRRSREDFTRVLLCESFHFHWNSENSWKNMSCKLCDCVLIFMQYLL